MPETETRWKCTVCGYIHHGKQPPEYCPNCGAHRYRFILDEPLTPELEAAVKAAFTGEAKAQVRNQAFAQRAEEEDLPQVARLFRAVAEAERVHAEEMLKYLAGVIGDTAENLQTAFEHELLAKDEAYPELIKAAYQAKREDVIWSLNRARDVEARHAQLYKDALAALTGDRKLDYQVCQVCGYVFDGEPPDNCPVCQAPRTKFKPIL